MRKKIKRYTSLVATVLLPLAALAQQMLVDYVNPMIGTAGMGHCFPGACAPFGFVQLSPETDTIPHNVNGDYQKQVYAYCAGYQHDDPTIVGFSHTHLSGTGHSDLGDIMLMPQTGSLRLNPGTADNPDAGYRQRVNHATEKAFPGYYEVRLKDNGVRVRLTATQHVGVHHYTYPAGADSRIILDMLHGIYNYDGKVLWSSIRVENDTLVTGYRITNGWARQNYIYFAMTFSKPIASYGYRDMRRSPYNGFLGKMDIHHNFPEIAGRAVVAWFNFDNHKSQDITVKVGLSAVSTDGAMRNLQAETGGKSFDDILASTRTQWEKELSVITCQGDNDRKAMLYTSLYHTMINPSVYMDVDRRYRGLDGNIHVAGDFDNYTVFSLWDTYRAEHPLLSLLKPDRNTSMVRSMLACQQQSVHHILPVWGIMGNEGWCMTGYHAVSVVADAIVNGDAVPVDEAMRAMTSTAVSPLFPGLKDYISRGWSPYDRDAQAASNTLEYAYDDWAIGAAARKAGRPDIAEAFLRRSLNWRNTFDTSRGFAAPRYANGTYKKNFDPCQTYGEGFIEGNSWNFSFAVPHDVGGLIKYMGGDRPFIAKLDSLFQMDLPPVYYKDNEDITEECLIGGYVHGNEPSHHIPYLYAWTSQPWKTQRWVRLIMNRMYRNEIRGLGGNDDCGQMSAWYVFSAMGFYPVCPGSGQYVLGAPLLPYMRVSLPNGKTIEIIAPKVSDKRCYVQSVRINGRPYSKLFITRSQLSEGCRIEFVMGSKPNRQRGLDASDKPYSLTGAID
jgi:predicted alpha-1,2-mannosidase